MIHPELEDYLLSLPTAKNDDDFLLPVIAEQAQRNISPLSKVFRKLMKLANIESRKVRAAGKDAVRTVYGLSFHSLRHSFNSILANAGVSEERRMALTGHTTRDVHQRYTHHELERLRDAIALLPKL